MASDPFSEPRGWPLAGMLLVGGIGFVGVFVPFVPSTATLVAAAPVALLLAFGAARWHAVAAERRAGAPEPRQKRLATIVFGTLLLLFAYYAVAMTLPFAWTTATGTPGSLVAELEPVAIGSRHRTCDYRLQDGITGLPGTVSVCVDGGTFRRLRDRRVRVEVRGPRTLLGLRIDGHEVREDLGPLR